MSNKDNEFWQFSVAVYEQPQVAKYCLALQDDYGLNVNVLLLCCWQGQQGNNALTSEFFQQILSDIWLSTLRDEVIKPLRKARVALKAQPEQAAQQLRAKVIQLELLAEQAEQAALYAWPSQPELREKNGAAMENLQRYATVAEADELCLPLLANLICAVFPEADKNC